MSARQAILECISGRDCTKNDTAQAVVDHVLSLLSHRGYAIVPKKPSGWMLEIAAHNLCGEYGVKFVQGQEAFVTDAYAELVAAANR